jgi:hypothetical protein
VISIVGDVTQGHPFRAYKIANYTDTITKNGKAIGQGVETLVGVVNIGGNTLSDGSQVGGAESPLNFRQTVAQEIVAIEKQRTGKAPTPDAAGLIEEKDPLLWASTQWQLVASDNEIDPWLNTNMQASGPFRTFADWLEDELLATESNTCTTDGNAKCFGLYYDEETGVEYSDGKSRAVFDLDDQADEEISAVTATHPQAFGAGLYVVLHPQPQSHQDGYAVGTHAPAMILGTRIPLTVEGATTYSDLYDAQGATLVQPLGLLNVKGDTVAVSLKIDDKDKQSNPSYGLGDVIPFVIQTNIPFYNNFLRTQGASGYTGEYKGGRTAGSARENGTPIINPFGHRAANVEHWTSDIPSKASNPFKAWGAAAKSSEALITQSSYVQSAPSFVFAASDTARNPIRVDVVLDYSKGLGDPNPSTMAVSVGSTSLEYNSACILNEENTSTPCFGFAQSASNAEGERYFIVQIPDWVARENGGKTVQIEYSQRLESEAESDIASVSQHALAAVSTEFTNNSYVADYTDFTDPEMYGSITSADPLSVYTFPLNLTKVDSHSNATLSGAQFSISQDGVDECFVLSAGTYYRSRVAPCPSEETSTLNADTSGRVSIKGLEAQADYQVRETKQPDGYDSNNLKMVDFSLRIEPTYSSSATSVEVLATEYVYAGASYLKPKGLPAYLRPATNEWVNDVDHVKHTFYAHEIDVLNGKTSQDVDAIAPFPWDALAKTGIGLLIVAIATVLLIVIGVWLRRRRNREIRTISAITV